MRCRNAIWTLLSLAALTVSGMGICADTLSSIRGSICVDARESSDNIVFYNESDKLRLIPLHTVAKGSIQCFGALSAIQGPVVAESGTSMRSIAFRRGESFDLSGPPAYYRFRKNEIGVNELLYQGKYVYEIRRCDEECQGKSVVGGNYTLRWFNKDETRRKPAYLESGVNQDFDLNYDGDGFPTNILRLYAWDLFVGNGTVPVDHIDPGLYRIVSYEGWKTLRLEKISQ